MKKKKKFLESSLPPSTQYFSVDLLRREMYEHETLGDIYFPTSREGGEMCRILKSFQGIEGGPELDPRPETCNHHLSDRSHGKFIS